MAGGNTSSRKQPYRMKKFSQNANDNRALRSAELSDLALGYSPDMEFGYGTDGAIAKSVPGDVEKNTWKGGWPGPGITRSRDPGKAKGDDTPGGGW